MRSFTKGILNKGTKYDGNFEPEYKISIEAFNSYQEKAKEEDIEAMYNLGRAYADGDVVQQDNEKTSEWFMKAAIAGLPVSQMFLGVRYQRGIGLRKDTKKGFNWLMKASKNGNSLAQAYLGEAYKDGVGVSIDYDKAI